MTDLVVAPARVEPARRSLKSRLAKLAGVAVVAGTLAGCYYPGYGYGGDGYYSGYSAPVYGGYYGPGIFGVGWGWGPGWYGGWGWRGGWGYRGWGGWGGGWRGGWGGGWHGGWGGGWGGGWRGRR